jgi:cellulose synthase/poly-beta-1,6-N-acetylglucosamine synthase-like glycosyltransferase
LLEALGGWDPDVLAEDTDLTFRVVLAGYKVRYVNEAECYEEAVENWHAYWRQRTRWAKGHMQCFLKHIGSLLKSSNLSFKQRVDGLLLLSVYFIPLLVLLSWILGALIVLFAPIDWLDWIGSLLPLFAYSSVGNFALFFELGVGIYLDGRARLSWLLPLLLLSFVVNVTVCVCALLNLCFSRIAGNNKRHLWVKTFHNGGKC